MANYIQGNQVISVANPDLNPDLIKGLTQVSDSTPTLPTSQINSALLTPINSNGYTTPPATPVLPISGIDTKIPDQTLTQPEQGISDLTKRITDIQNSLVGKSSYTADQQNAQGLPTLLATQKDLASQIDAYKVQMQSLQNTATTIPSIMQQGAEGRGVTIGGLAPLTAGELRKNQIQQAGIASQALTTQASLYATQGKIGAAQILIDQAVAQKYGAIEEDLKAKIANLDVLLKDPSISLAEKNRANAQAVLLKQQEETIAKNKQDQTDIWKVSTDASANIANFTPTAQYPVANAALSAIQSAKTPQIAQQIAVDTGLTKSTQTSTILGLIKTYPDAGILPNDSLATATQKASDSFSFHSKNNTIRAIADPITGEITYYYNKGGTGGLPTSNIGGTSSPQLGTQQIGIQAVNPLIKPAVETVLGQSYIDLGKLRDSEKALAAQSSNASGLPLLSPGDSDKIQAANQAYQSASTLIKELTDLSTKVLTAPNDRLSMATQAAKLKTIETVPYLSTNNEAKSFISARQSLLSLITRAAGEKGTLTDTDVSRIANALPSYGDNKELAAQKAANLDNVIKSVFSGSITAYIGSATQNKGQGDQNQGQTSGGNSYTIIQK